MVITSAMPSPSPSSMTRHPLQRFASPSRGVSAALHMLGLVSFALSFKYLVDYPSHINESYGWHYQFLTIIGLTIATGTFAFGLLADVTLSPTLFVVKNSLSLCSAPLEVVISILYWGISAIDKALVVPPDVAISLYADVGFHAMPAILLTIDLLFFSPPWAMAAVPTMALSSVLASSYWVWVNQCYKYNGFYPYPLFEQLDTPQRALVFSGAALIMTVSTILLQSLYRTVNGLEVLQKRTMPNGIKGE